MINAAVIGWVEVGGTQIWLFPETSNDPEVSARLWGFGKSSSKIIMSSDDWKRLRTLICDNFRRCVKEHSKNPIRREKTWLITNPMTTIRVTSPPMTYYNYEQGTLRVLTPTRYKGDRFFTKFPPSHTSSNTYPYGYINLLLQHFWQGTHVRPLPDFSSGLHFFNDAFIQQTSRSS